MLLNTSLYSVAKFGAQNNIENKKSPAKAGDFWLIILDSNQESSYSQALALPIELMRKATGYPLHLF